MTPDEFEGLRQLCHNARPDCKGSDECLGCEGCAVPKAIEDIWNAGAAALTAERDKIIEENGILKSRRDQFRYERDRLLALNKEMLDELYRLRSVVGDVDIEIIDKVIAKVEKSST